MPLNPTKTCKNKQRVLAQTNNNCILELGRGHQSILLYFQQSNLHCMQKDLKHVVMNLRGDFEQPQILQAAFGPSV